MTAEAGAALPTGGYTTRSGQGALGDAARTLTVGRGVTWGIANAEARWAATRAVAVTCSAEGRVPFGEAPDGFRWGPEIRAFAEGEIRPFGPMFGFALGTEFQARATGSIIDPFLGTRARSDNVRATVLSVVPGVRAQLPSGWFFSLSARVPVFQDQEGLQFRQGLGAFAGIGFVLPLFGGSGTAVEPKADARYVVREYGATWCEPCKRLAPLLDATARDRADVRVERIDVTEWSDDELAARVPDAKAFPIVLILRPDGSLVRRLEGEDTFRFAEYIMETTK